MKKSIYLFQLFSVAVISSMLCCCSDDIINSNKVDELETPETRSAFNDYFDWDRIDGISTFSPNVNQNITIDLPWDGGSTVSIGIPTTWLDENASNPTYSNRYYARENGWNLVYSNMLKHTNTKYFALHNKYTGILRFFFYEIASSAGSGTTTSFWGIKMDKPSSLFNFTGTASDGMDKSMAYPSYITTSEGTIIGNSFTSIGYKANNWYGFEIECAYDPTIKNNSAHNFEVKGWAAETINLTGNATTTGTIKGTIEIMPQATNFNLNLSNLLNKTNSEQNIVAKQEGVAGSLGSTIESGIAKNDSFFVNLWKNIKTKAGLGISAGVQSGLKSILSSGGSFVVKALGGAVKSIFGIGGSKPSIGKVDLCLSSQTNITLTGETNIVGWGAISSFPVPGSTTNVNNLPLYNKPLGAWNLKETPIVIVSGEEEGWHNTEEDYEDGDEGFPFHCFSYWLQDCEIILNPEIQNLFRIENQEQTLICRDEYYIMNIREEQACAYFNSQKYYDVSSSPSTMIIRGEGDISEGMNQIEFYARISFDLVNINNPQIVYSFSKYFSVNEVEGEYNIN